MEKGELIRTSIPMESHMARTIFYMHREIMVEKGLTYIEFHSKEEFGSEDRETTIEIAFLTRTNIYNKYSKAFHYRVLETKTIKTG